MRTGRWKSIWSTCAVTTGVRAWRPAAIAAQMSIQCITRPPITLPSGLASLGKTISVISVCEAETGRPSDGAWSAVRWLLLNCSGSGALVQRVWSRPRR